ncbi:cell wall hydrolase [Sphingobium phenoxybenzoativorans]|uniref:cell wall hydrolase n=1 Tax=Sphingobium phenoxybenzoativorans TaxID=1592790 RepID=UPI0008734517|nr:cell wall hydrolase [Sphingobium phenoxybenzoativorans]
MARTETGKLATLLRALLFAVAIVLLPRLLPSGWTQPLDKPEAKPPIILAGAAADNFPGSAYFLAEGAFTPIRNLTIGQSNPYIYRLDDGPTAPSVTFRGMTPVDRYRAANCLAAAIYYEAGNETEDGQRAVAQVVLNRVRHPAWPNSVCAVVYQGSERSDLKCQFSFSCDGAMARTPNATAWGRARRIAVEALAGKAFAPVGLATYYHTLAVSPPWSADLQPVAVIGAHIFYRWKGTTGQPAAFSDRYARFEFQSGPAPRAVLLSAPALAITPPVDPAPAPEQSAVQPPPDIWNSNIRPEYRSSGRPLVP